MTIYPVYFSFSEFYLSLGKLLKFAVMKYLAFLFFSLFCLAAHAQDSLKIKALDKKNGFRNMILGSQIDSSNLEFIEELEGLKRYSPKIVNRKIGDYEINGIGCEFYKNKLALISITIIGENNCNGVLATVKDLYGNGEVTEEEDPDNFGFVWQGNLVQLTFTENKKIKMGHLEFLSIPVIEKLQADKKEKAKKDF